MKIDFADTWYFLALLSPSDQGHATALEYTKSFDGTMMTSGWVLTEVGDALAGTPQGRAEFISLKDDLVADPQARVVPFDDLLFHAGVDFYAKRPDKLWSLTDCISFVIMQRENISEALTRDHHFEQAGFVALLK
jgi:predicted nucleic acid-binding protein